MTFVDETREELTLLLGRAEQWFDGLGVLKEHAPNAAETATESARLCSLRTRALATQLNVGLVGRQSAGKSFLISGLQGGLQYFRGTDTDDDYFEEYRGLLPSSANPTTACPSTIVPVQGDASVDASERGLLRVRFSDEDWVDIGNDLAPAVIAAYGASDGQRVNRRENDVGKHVEEIELLISKYRLPVKLFDLPGAESVIEENDLIMRNSWKEADCFIYVSQGTSALTVNELDLIRDLYTEHLTTAKRVLWVLTGIDRATQMEHGQAAWKNVLTTNNEYLRHHFSAATNTLNAFIGEGFLPVSAAWEAQAAFADASETGGASLRRRSRMDVLRVQLTELINSGAGQRHLVQVAEEARLLIHRRQRPIADLLDTHQVSSKELEKQKTNVSDRLARVTDGVERQGSQLHASLERSIRTSQKPFSDLTKELHLGLDGLIDSGNLGAEHVSEINIREVQLFNEWMAKEASPKAIWQQELVKLDADARSSLRSIIGGDSTGSQLVPPEPLDTSTSLFSADQRRPLGVYGIVKVAATTVGVASPLVGGVTMIAAGAGLATIAFPVAATVGAAIAVAKLVDVVKSRESAVQRHRAERKLLINSQADQSKESFTKAAREQGIMLIDAAQSHLETYRRRLQDTLTQIEERIQAPDNVASRELVSRLTPVDQNARDILTDLQTLSTHARD